MSPIVTDIVHKQYSSLWNEVRSYDQNSKCEITIIHITCLNKYPRVVLNVVLEIVIVGPVGFVWALLVAVVLVYTGPILWWCGSWHFLFVAAGKTSFVGGNGVIAVASEEGGAGRREEVARTNGFGWRRQKKMNQTEQQSTQLFGLVNHLLMLMREKLRMWLRCSAPS